MGGVAGLYWDNYFFIVKKTKVNFLRSSVNASIQEDAGQKAEVSLNSLKGKNIWKLELEKVQADILKDTRIESVSIKRELPDMLVVEMKFRPVVFVYIDVKQRLRPVAEDGTLLNSVAINQAPDVPILRNHQLAQDPKQLRQLVSLYRQLPSEGLLSPHHIAQVDWTESEGLKVELNHSEDGFIVIGSEHIPTKSKRIESVLKYLESQKTRWRVIDASFSKKVLVRLRKRS